MSKFKGPNHYGESGQIAGTIYYKQFGQQLARSVPGLDFKDKNSTLQRNQRYARFAPCIEFASGIRWVAKAIYETQPASRTAFSQMIKQLMLGFGGTEIAPQVDFKKVTLGSGQIPILPLLTCIGTNHDTITVTWSTELNVPSELATDSFQFMISAPGNLKAVVSENVARSVGTLVITVPFYFQNEEVAISTPVITSDDGSMKSPFTLCDAQGLVDLA
jgi:hypothetical protein